MFKNAWMIVAVALLAGCIDLPAKYEVIDNSTQRKFTTYESWGQPGPDGYAFYDATSRSRVLLKDYSRRTLNNGGMYSKASLEAVEYRSELHGIAELDK